MKQTFLIIIFILCMISKLFSVDTSVMTNFPYGTSGDFYGSGAVADIDADGIKEFIIGDKSGYVYAVQSDGTSKQGFPLFIEGPIWSSPCIGDINNDGYAEIIIGAKNYNLYAIDYKGNILKNFPIKTGNDIRSAPALADIDCNGTLDIVFSGVDGLLYVVDGNGEAVENFPKPIDPEYSEAFDFFKGARAAPIISDYDKNNKLEIILGSNGGLITGFYNTGERFFSFKANNRIDGSPVVKDMDNDNIDEFIFIAWDYYIYIFNIIDGKFVLKENFPFFVNTLVRSSPIIFHLNNNNADELAVPALSNYNVINKANLFVNVNLSAEMSSYLFSLYGSASTPCAFYDKTTGDPIFIYGNHYNSLGEIECNSIEKTSKFKKLLAIQGIIESSPVLNDFNNDGKFDIIVGTENKNIYALNTNIDADYNRIINSKFRNDLNNSGNYINFSTPLIYEPKKTIIHSKNVTFKWINMEGINGVYSSYNLNGSEWSDSNTINEISFNNLEDTEYIFRVKQFYNKKYTLTPGYKKIIIDNKLPEANLIPPKERCGGFIVLKGTANDKNFGYYVIQLKNNFYNVIDSYESNIKIDSDSIFSFDSTKYTNGKYTIVLTVFEQDTNYFNSDSIQIDILNVSDTVYTNKRSFINFDTELSVDFLDFSINKDMSVNISKADINISNRNYAVLSNIYSIEFDENNLTKNFIINFKLNSINIKNSIRAAVHKAITDYNNLLLIHFDGSTYSKMKGYYNSAEQTYFCPANKSGYYFLSYSNIAQKEKTIPFSLSQKKIFPKNNEKIYFYGYNSADAIKIYNINGKLITNFYNNYWDGHDSNNKTVVPGLYIIVYRNTKNIIFVK